MGQNVKVNYKEFAEFYKQVEKLDANIRQDFMEQCAKELAARLLQKAIKRTPVGIYKNRTGGTLRRAWSKANQNMRVVRTGSFLRVEINNPTEYASYVEYGHRTRGGKGWVQGHFMMTISVQEIQSMAPSFLQKKLESKLREAFK